MATFAICSIPDCGKKVFRRGWCSPHYYRWLRHADPLAGTTYRGSAREFFNNVVLTHEADECLRWPFMTNKQGYGLLSDEGYIAIVSRLVCEAANGPAPSPEHEAAHNCGKGNEACCAKRHLEWKTHIANMADKQTHGTQLRGQKVPNSKLTEDDVLQIRSLKGVLSQPKIAIKFGVSRGAVQHILNGNNWAWL